MKIIENYVQDFERFVKRSKKINVQQLKLKLAKKYKLNKIPTNIEILTNSKHYDELRNILITKPRRTESGVTVCAVMTAPFPCPHGKCTYCPGGLKSIFGTVPQSYTGNEPASKRGKRNFYDPYLQIFNRLEQYVTSGHNIDKIELIIMGGTFLSFPLGYQYDFDFYSFKALNDFSYLFFNKPRENMTKKTNSINGYDIDEENKSNNQYSEEKHTKSIIDFELFKKFFLLPGSIKDEDRIKSIQKRVFLLKHFDLEKIIFALLKHNEFEDKKMAILYIFDILNSFINQNTDNLNSFNMNNFEFHYKKNDNKINNDIAIQKREFNNNSFETSLKKNKFQNMKNNFLFYLKNNKKDSYNLYNLFNSSIIKIINDDSLEKEQKRNETSNVKCVGLTIETRPDYGFKNHGLQLLKFGATRVELGIQSLNDSVLKKVNRGHSVSDSIKSIYELKELGFKLNFHIMLGLPLTTKEDDIQTIKKLFEDENFRPDMLKIYPTLVMKGTRLYDDWILGKYKAIDVNTAIEIITEAYKYIPLYCRVMRVQRDIPSTIVQTNIKTNLRQIVEKKLKEINESGIKIWEIRFREVKNNTVKKTKIFVYKYRASKGIEYFISVEDPSRKYILGFCRLRFPKGELIPQITKHTAIIRELHVYGKSQQIGIRDKTSFQHRSLGKQLLIKAEEISKKNNKNKIIIISGVGVREYYRKQGYHFEKPYMVKDLK